MAGGSTVEGREHESGRQKHIGISLAWCSKSKSYIGVGVSQLLVEARMLHETEYGSNGVLGVARCVQWAGHHLTMWLS